VYVTSPVINGKVHTEGKSVPHSHLPFVGSLVISSLPSPHVGTSSASPAAFLQVPYFSVFKTSLSIPGNKPSPHGTSEPGPSGCFLHSHIPVSVFFV